MICIFSEEGGDTVYSRTKRTKITYPPLLPLQLINQLPHPTRRVQLERIFSAAERDINEDGDCSGDAVGRWAVFERRVDPAFEELRFGFIELGACFVGHVFSFGDQLRALHRRTAGDDAIAQKCGRDCGGIFSKS